jgi:hypothetical protein
MLRPGRQALLALLLVAILAPAAIAQPEAVCSGRLAVSVGSESLQVPYCANVDLGAGDLTRRRAIVVIHGSDRNAGEYLG